LTARQPRAKKAVGTACAQCRHGSNGRRTDCASDRADLVQCIGAAEAGMGQRLEGLGSAKPDAVQAHNSGKSPVTDTTTSFHSHVTGMAISAYHMASTASLTRNSPNN